MNWLLSWVLGNNVLIAQIDLTLKWRKTVSLHILEGNLRCEKYCCLLFCYIQTNVEMDVLLLQGEKKGKILFLLQLLVIHIKY